ncbi:hypothetical protein GX50_01485 [[Emmonsia] crescens]|uniref:non-specific serine/threonine protein kinase n=1 Tax=[Emmonsia] crescens TaxID=73230 RepID=A0A2B7ZS93_9EURO|nr:hypothetical protein GX50_01485 [Emmonsia crescens]
MEPSSVKYKFMKEVEHLDYYIPGGYHPVMVSDKFCADRYTIAHKLGFGRSATAWLAENTKQSRLVALKISTAESAERTHEMQILSHLASAKSGLTGGKATVQKLLDSFMFSRPNGTHQCLVTDATRINIHELKDAAYHRLLHLPAARAIASQLIIESRFAGDPGEDSVSFPADIWMLACTIWDIFGSSPPFEAFPITLDEVTIKHVELLGKLPN